ncbi:MAG: hypothetical protein VXW98_03880, partial [Actinomycetota bacterium]|nr:hypothetical protein [Actinomycetota bacterium]
MTHLDLKSNKIGNAGFKVLSTVLGNMPNLTELRLSSNGIGVAGTQAFWSAVHRTPLPQLQVLGLGNNK